MCVRNGTDELNMVEAWLQVPADSSYHGEYQEVRKWMHSITSIVRSPEFNVLLLQMAPVTSELCGTSDHHVGAAFGWIVASLQKMPVYGFTAYFMFTFVEIPHVTVIAMVTIVTKTTMVTKINKVS
jgi:ABC-type methionine transport system permease subunit